MAGRGEASKGKRQAVKAVLKAFRAMLFGLLSPKCSTRESVMPTEIPSTTGEGKVMGSINKKGPQGFQEGKYEWRDLNASQEPFRCTSLRIRACVQGYRPTDLEDIN